MAQSRIGFEEFRAIGALQFTTRFLMLRNKKAPSVKMVLSVDDRNKVASLFVVLIKIDRRISKEKKSLRRKKAKQRRKYDDLGSHDMRALFYLSQK